MQEQEPLVELPAHLAELFESLRDPSDEVLSPGFYARVNQIIQSSRTASLWSFAQTSTGSRVAVAFGLLTLLLIGVASMDEPDKVAPEFDAQRSYATAVPIVGSADEQRDAVLRNFAAYPLRSEMTTPKIPRSEVSPLTGNLER